MKSTFSVIYYLKYQVVAIKAPFVYCPILSQKQKGRTGMKVITMESSAFRSLME